jgi:hypothetical protein
MWFMRGGDEAAECGESCGVEKYARKRRRELLLDEMEQIVPSGVSRIGEPHYAKAGKGRRP